MISQFHFLRPWALALLLPFIVLLWACWRQRLRESDWQAICDPHLLAHLVQGQGDKKRHGLLICLAIATLFMILALAGPSWIELPVPAYQPAQPRVVLLSMSENMLADDIKPDRLSRARFKLHDLFNGKHTGQFGLIAYTGEPFIVSPLTQDGQTIDALLADLTPSIMPITGDRLDSALLEAQILLKQSSFNTGDVLVITAQAPSKDDIEQAKKLAAEGIRTSVLAMIADKNINPRFAELASAGQGLLLPFDDASTDINAWLSQSATANNMSLSQFNDIPVWQDEGRWFLIPAFLCLLPMFRRANLARMSS